MTVHIIAVGTSINEHFETLPKKVFGNDREAAAVIGQAKPQLLLDAVGDKDQASDWIAAALAAPGQRSAAQRAELKRVADLARPDLWPTQISAEVATLERPPAGTRTLAATDIAYLICSDTKDGLTAGLWNAIALTECDLERISYEAEPGAVTAEWGKAVIVRVAGMDAANNKGFGEAMEGMGTLGNRLVRGPDSVPADEPFHFYLSGGYKAAIPYLIGLAEGLRSLDSNRTVKAYVLHDSAKAEEPLIELPLRSIPPGWVISELGKFHNGARAGVPDEPLLKGYAYEVSGNECKLTPFGAGLVTLFDLEPPRLGG